MQHSPPDALRGEARPSRSGQTQSVVYKAVMTPIIFVSFLFSLAWVEFRYSVLRSHSHNNSRSSSSSSSSSSSNAHDADDCRHTWMPSWLHHLVYRRQAYQYVVVHKNDKSDSSDKNDNKQNYYHSMQRKLLKMETAEAFRVRTTVLAVMTGGAAVALWGAVASVRWLSARAACHSTAATHAEVVGVVREHVVGIDVAAGAECAVDRGQVVAVGRGYRRHRAAGLKTPR
ncbi:hypothetical protein F503_00574 [Ophiostoma piceae UAMH 11346]|uniref:Uncharacterized protein n=1 Tax=Ophiostoma piceae (strain UAMH 11346) TaxID=1262450 RepID=S3C4Y0_OPHP1|nr:hypothetical protein F503_00574 [Ophiostoma piceae UAMH 11346]